MTQYTNELDLRPKILILDSVFFRLLGLVLLIKKTCSKWYLNIYNKGFSILLLYKRNRYNMDLLDAASSQVHDILAFNTIIILLAFNTIILRCLYNNFPYSALPLPVRGHWHTPHFIL